MRRREQPVERRPEDKFMVLFTALSMILLAFFIMLNSMATIDASRTRAAMGSLVGTFGPLPGFEQRHLRIELEHETAKQRGNHLEKMIRSHLEGETNLDVVQREDGTIVVSVGPDLAFRKGGYEISPRAFDMLDKVGVLITKLKLPVRIEGYADKTPSPNNWVLSARRASSVYRYLAASEPLTRELVTAAGYGDSRPDKHGEYRASVEIIFIPRHEGKR